MLVDLPDDLLVGALGSHHVDRLLAQRGCDDGVPYCRDRYTLNGQDVRPNRCCSGRADGRMRAYSNKSVARAPLFLHSYTLLSPMST